MKENLNNSSMIIYQSEDGLPKIDVRIENETVWLTQQQIADLFECTSYNVGLHLKNIYADEESNKEATTEEISVARIEDSRQINGSIIHYNLDTILSVMEAT